MLGVLALGLTQLQASGVPQTDVLLSASQSVAGQKELAKHYDAGSGSPLIVTAPEGARQQVLDAVKATPHVTDASVYTGTRGRRPGLRPRRRSSTVGCSCRRPSTCRRTRTPRRPR